MSGYNLEAGACVVSTICKDGESSTCLLCVWAWVWVCACVCVWVCLCLGVKKWWFSLKFPYKPQRKSPLRCSFYHFTLSHNSCECLKINAEIRCTRQIYSVHLWEPSYFLALVLTPESRRAARPCFVLLCFLSNGLICVLMATNITSAGLKSNLLCDISFFPFFFLPMGFCPDC